MVRRDFIQQASLGLLSLPIITGLDLAPGEQALTFGLVADVHKDLMPDADQRLEVFIQEAMVRNVDMIIQLGDFCMAEKSNDSFMNIWRSFKGPRYHVLGNHDMDKQSKEEMLDFWEMPSKYYAFEESGIKFIVLDANYLYQDGEYTNYNKANFYVDDGLRTFVNGEQIEWLQGELSSTTKPSIILSHQSLWHYQWGVKNRLEIQQILETHHDKIICCLNGHNHIDYHHVQNGINYLEINSMSYYWLGEKYKNYERYPKELYDEFKWLPHLGAYQDPLFAFISIQNGQLTLEGRKSQWVSPSPYETGMPEGVVGNRATAEISDVVIKGR